jgi:hypothetical protein
MLEAFEDGLDDEPNVLLLFVLVSLPELLRCSSELLP